MDYLNKSFDGIIKKIPKKFLKNQLKFWKFFSD